MRDRLQSSKCARFLKALADPDRLKLVQALQTGPKTVTELSLLLEKELANVSHHLRVMAHGGLVETEKDGKFVIYRLHPDVFHKDPENQSDVFDLGCCRLELNNPPRNTPG